MRGAVVFDRNKSVLLLASKLVPRTILEIVTWMLDSSEMMFALGARYVLMKRTLEYCGNAVFFGRSIVIKNPQGLRIGDNCSVHAFTYIDAAGGVHIGRNVSIAHGCSLVSFEHTWTDHETPIKYNEVRLSGVVIEDDVWLGCGVRVLAGARIGSRSVVAAGAVVKGCLEGGYLYAGVPARPLRALR